MSLRSRFRNFTEDPRFQRVIIALIVINAAILGLETVPSVMDRMGGVLHAIDDAILAVFVIELAMRIIAHGAAFFVPFILIATFTMLNLFIAVVVNAMQSRYHEEGAAEAEAAHREREETLTEIRALRAEVSALTEALHRERGSS